MRERMTWKREQRGEIKINLRPKTNRYCWFWFLQLSNVHRSVSIGYGHLEKKNSVTKNQPKLTDDHPYKPDCKILDMKPCLILMSV